MFQVLWEKEVMGKSNPVCLQNVTFLDYVGEMNTINCGGETLLWKKTLMVMATCSFMSETHKPGRIQEIQDPSIQKYLRHQQHLILVQLCTNLGTFLFLLFPNILVYSYYTAYSCKCTACIQQPAQQYEKTLHENLTHISFIC